jgi:hypothetical protein
MMLEHNTAIQIFPVGSDIGFSHLAHSFERQQSYEHILIKWSNQRRERETDIVKVNVIRKKSYRGEKKNEASWFYWSLFSLVAQ